MVLGFIIQVITSWNYHSFPQPLNSYMTVGEWLLLMGQAVGELTYIIAGYWLVKQIIFFRIIIEGVIAVALVGIVGVCVNPWEVSMSKYTGFIFAICVILIRTWKYSTQYSKN